MAISAIPKAEPEGKSISLAEQIAALQLLRRQNLKRILPGTRPSEIERVKLSLDAAIKTLSQLTDW